MDDYEILQQVRKAVAREARALGRPIFEPLDPEIEALIKGVG